MKHRYKKISDKAVTQLKILAKNCRPPVRYGRRFGDRQDMASAIYSVMFASDNWPVFSPVASSVMLTSSF